MGGRALRPCYGRFIYKPLKPKRDDKFDKREKGSLC